MHVVAIHSLAADKEKRALELAAVLGVTVFEALSRLRAFGLGPLVVGVFGERAQADTLSAKLESGGFRSLVLSADEIEAGAHEHIVRRFALGEQDLQVEPQEGGTIIVPYRDIDLILRGTGISSSSSTETTKQRKFDLGTAVVSGGLKMTQTTKTVREVTTEEREGLLRPFGGMGLIFLFRENGLVYDALGSLRGLSRSGNFINTLSELRRRCATALYDERLLNRAGLAALLGPRLNPEQHSVVAFALLAKALRSGMET